MNKTPEKSFIRSNVEALVRLAVLGAFAYYIALPLVRLVADNVDNMNRIFVSR